MCKQRSSRSHLRCEQLITAFAVSQSTTAARTMCILPRCMNSAERAADWRGPHEIIPQKTALAFVKHKDRRHKHESVPTFWYRSKQPSGAWRGKYSCCERSRFAGNDFNLQGENSLQCLQDEGEYLRETSAHFMRLFSHSDDLDAAVASLGGQSTGGGSAQS